MAYKRDQGRYARMAAFWLLTLLVAYGCLTGLEPSLTNWIGESDPWVKPFPLLGKLDLTMAIALGVLLIVGLLIHRFLNRQKAADMLIETESEMRKVTWPTFLDAWHGTLAVLVTVVFMGAFLAVSDVVLTYALSKVMGGG